jgi:hypothetical protein
VVIRPIARRIDNSRSFARPTARGLWSHVGDKIAGRRRKSPPPKETIGKKRDAGALANVPAIAPRRT